MVQKFMEALRQAMIRNDLVFVQKAVEEALLNGYTIDYLFAVEAAVWGQDNVLKELMKVCDVSKGSSQALRWSAEKGNLECVKLLIPASDPNALDASALQQAVLSKHQNVIDILLPVSNYNVVLDYFKNQTNFEAYSLLAERIQQFEALSQKSRLLNNIKEVAPKINNAFRKI